MKQKDKELVLKEISSRFPYGVKVFSKILNKLTLVKGITDDSIWVYVDEDNYEWEPIEDVKLYLRPLSSMSDEEKRYLMSLKYQPFAFEWKNLIISSQEIIDWLNRKMFDYRGLIPMGLALEVTKENNPYET